MSCARSALVLSRMLTQSSRRNDYDAHAALVRTAPVASCLLASVNLPVSPRQSLYRVMLVQLHVAISVLQAGDIVPVDGTWAMVSE